VDGERRVRKPVCLVSSEALEVAVQLLDAVLHVPAHDESVDLDEEVPRPPQEEVGDVGSHLKFQVLAELVVEGLGRRVAGAALAVQSVLDLADVVGRRLSRSQERAAPS